MTQKFQEIISKAIPLSEIKDFEREINFRPFELSITNIASSYILDEELQKELLQEINKLY